MPLVVPADEVPLAEEPVVRALLDLLEAALRPDGVDEPAALALLVGPDQAYLTTEEFLAALDENLATKLA